jgi:hypothetical protein
VTRKQRRTTDELPQNSDRAPGTVPTPLDVEIRTPAGHSYIVKSDHRSLPTEHKSAWCISVSEEIACFDRTIAANWTQDSVGWGLHITHQEPLILGNNLLRDFKIGKFVSDPQSTIWHGYPADYRTKLQDRPPAGILTAWRDAGIIQKHEIARVRQGKPCSLSD